ncbi:MAG: 16S rRNA (uracil(1498)-N(3))-methyltransferase [Acidobacteriota bacterium]|nr:16S rRNA (uracil(1498)-N(3))-methyltransferase [Acidobacteriota bacterium]
MRRRFFVEHFEGASALMEGELAHHVGRVLRAQPGQQYELSDGQQAWLGEIVSVARDSVEFKLLEQLPASLPSLETTLLLSIVKFDAFEWALEKATELGVSHIVPLAAARSEKGLLAAAEKREARWKKILLESSQQSRRTRVPRLVAPEKPEAAFASQRQAVRIFLSEAPDAKPLRQLLAGQQGTSAVLAIGPEGGWTEQEFAAARSAGFLEASLGKFILRTETAVIASLAALNFVLSSD